MLQYKGFLVDDNLNIYSARTGMQLTPTKGSDGYMQVQFDRHKVARILKGEIDNYYDYDFDYAM